MAKRRGRKSAAIKTVLAAKPTASVNQAALAKKRVKASIGLTSKVKGGKNGHVSIEHLLAAKSLVGRVGGIAAAQSALDALAKLVG
jgi:hypothetical protein